MTTPLNPFPYFYVIMVMIVVQFFAMLWLVGDISQELIYLRASVNEIKRPIRNEVVTVTFGLNETGGEYNPNNVEGRLFTVFGGKLYEMREMKQW